MRAWALGLVAVVALSCSSTTVFVCARDDQCVSPAGVQGACEATGFCSFPDPSCASGRRYGEYAGTGLGDACVAPVDDAGASSDGPCGQPGGACCPDRTCQSGACDDGHCPH